MHRIRSKLAVLALCLCVLAAAIIAPQAFAAGSGQTAPLDAFTQQGWLDGVAADRLQPHDPLTRAQAGVVPAILSQQSPEISAVSGATYSSRGIMAAVRDALSKAENGAAGS